MSDEATATVEVADNLKTIGDQIAGLTLKEAVDLSNYLKSLGIEPAAGGAVMVAAGGGGGDGEAAAEEQTEFDVILTAFGDKKLDVVKAVKAIMGNSLMEAKKLVEACPADIKKGASKEEAEDIKAKLEGAGAAVELK